VSGVALLGQRPGAFGVGATAPDSASSERPRTGTPAGCAEGQQAGSASPNFGFTPNQYLEAYGHDTLHSRGLTGHGIRVSLVEIDGFNPSDIATFGACFGVRVPPIHAIPIGIHDRLPPGPETTLDLEVLSAAAPGLAELRPYEGNGDQAGIYLSTVAALGTPGKRPDVISISLGICEPDLSQQRIFWRATNNAFEAAAAIGITTVVAAGDQGSSACKQPQPPGSEAPLAQLAVSSPASSNYVTAVGGTNLVLDPGNRISDQIAWGDAPDQPAGGGGGVSILSPGPWWQSGGVAGARTVPDLAALADIVPGYAIYCTAEPCLQDPDHTFTGWIPIGGTSAATPLTAGAVALADQDAGKHGQPAVGFLNPLIYQRHAKVARDVTSGTNDVGIAIPAAGGGGAPLGCCTASPGYDEATGWGSLNAPAFDRAAMAAYRASLH
jgi:kumamolisin